MKYKSYLRNLFIVGLVMFTVSYGAFRRWGQPDLKNSRLAYLEEHADSFNVLFFGSSITERNINPVRFDELLKQKGFHSRSFTFGMGGADMHQIDWAVRAVLRMNPRNLDYVFIELRPFESSIREQDQLSPPIIRWHDLHQTRSALETVALADSSPYTKRLERRVHREHFIYKYLPVGMMTFHPREGENSDFQPSLQGYVPYQPDDVGMLKQHARYLENLPAYFEAVERKRRHIYDEFSLRHYNLKALQAQRELIESHGATVVYWTGPTTHDYAFANELRKQGELPFFLQFDDAEQFPQLYDPSVRMDANHLSNDGTEIFVSLLAEAFLTRFDNALDLHESPLEDEAMARDL